MFRSSVVLFRLFGFRVRADWSWLLIALLVTWSLAEGFFPASHPGLSPAVLWVLGAAGALGLFFCIVVHEMSHGLAARRFGMPVHDITLFLFGGVASLEEEPPTPRAEFFMAAAGPAASVALAAALFGAQAGGFALGWPEPVLALLGYLWQINVLLVLFNMVPAFPLDGGRVLRAGLWSRSGDLRSATRTSARLGEIFGAGLVVLGVVTFLLGSFLGGIWWAVIGLFLRNASRSSFEQLRMRMALEGVPVRRIMKPEPVTVPPDLLLRDLVEQYMFRYQHKMYPVTENGTLFGWVTLGHVSGVPEENWDRTRVEEVAEPMSEENALAPDADAGKTLMAMSREGRSRMVVREEDGSLAGVLTLKDLLGYLSFKMELEDPDAGSGEGRS